MVRIVKQACSHTNEDIHLSNVILYMFYYDNTQPCHVYSYLVYYGEKRGGGDALPATPKYYRKKCKFSTSITEVEIIFVIYIFILSQSFNMSSSLDSKESINNSRHNFLPHRLSSLSHFTSLATLLKYPIQMHNAWNIEAKHNSE